MQHLILARRMARINFLRALSMLVPHQLIAKVVLKTWLDQPVMSNRTSAFQRVMHLLTSNLSTLTYCRPAPHGPSRPNPNPEARPRVLGISDCSGSRRLPTDIVTCAVWQVRPGALWCRVPDSSAWGGVTFRFFEDTTLGSMCSTYQ